jgi:hypothetical protein
MHEILIRFLIGGVVVSVFAVIGDILKPKSFAGLFGAAPSVALATLGLTIVSEGAAYVALEARSMLAGAIAAKPDRNCAESNHGRPRFVARHQPAHTTPVEEERGRTVSCVPSHFSGKRDADRKA